MPAGQTLIATGGRTIGVMATLAERIHRVTDLTHAQVEHLRSLCSSWQVLADLSFSDLLLYVRVLDQDLFEICAQLRPFTSQTLYPQDMIGMRMGQPEQPIVERAFREATIWSQDDPVLVDGIPIQMDAVPVKFDGRVIGVVVKEGSPATSRRPGKLEQVYLDLAERVSTMISEGSFPYRRSESIKEWPRVGDGLLVLDDNGRVTWASPNALSSIHRLGVQRNIMGTSLDALGMGETPALRAIEARAPMDGELVRRDTYISLRVMPLIQGGLTTGALALTRDISELRQKDRVISVKDATIREVHHRVKNNLQTIASLLRLQGRRASGDAKAALEESVMRITSIALVHETLSEQPQDVVEFGDVVRRIARMVTEGLMQPGNQNDIKVTGATGSLGADLATPLAVSVTELLQNAIEHAFPAGGSGTIGVELSRETDAVVVVVWDDGVGMSDEHIEGARLGLQIVRLLIAELGGRFSITSEGGTRAEISVPSPPPSFGG